VELQVLGTEDPVGMPTRSVAVEIRQYDTKHGVTSWWEPDSRLRIEVLNFSDHRLVEIAGNREGLISLARDLLTLAQEDIPGTRSMTYDAEQLDGDSETVMLTVQHSWDKSRLR
jgi:hypothetical protein